MPSQIDTLDENACRSAPASSAAHDSIRHAGSMEGADRRLGLDSVGTDLCCVIMDVRHQSRAGFDDLQAAVLARRPYEALLEVGGHGEPQRVKNLKAALTTRRTGLRKKMVTLNERLRGRALKW